ncbi:MAG: phage tail family protein [Clostridium baratii]|nr:phage tail family protein [Clostridium baratii]
MLNKNGKLRISLDGVANPDFMLITDINNPVLPSNKIDTITIPRRNGAIVQNAQLEPKVITVGFRIDNKGKHYNLETLKRQLAGWLSRAIEQEVELILGTEEKIKYNAIIEGEVNLERVFRDGEGSINFYCANPIGIGESHTLRIPIPQSSTTPIQVETMGTAPTYPVFEFTIAETLTNLTVTSGDDFVDLGTPLSIGEEIDTYSKYLINDPCRSLNGWSRSQSIYDGIVLDQELVIRDNEVIAPKGDYVAENENTWGYCAIEKSLIGTAQDFKACITCYQVATSKDGSTNQKFSVVLKDKEGRDFIIAKLEDNNDTINGIYISFYLVQENANKLKLLNHIKIPNEYNKFYGSINISRIGKAWRFWLIGRNKSDKFITLAEKKWIDSTGEFMNRKPKTIQVGLGRWKKAPVGYMSFNHVTIENLDAHETQENTVPPIASRGDVIKIDCNTGEIYKNDMLWYEFFNPSSTFIKVKPNKVNSLIIYPDGAISTGSIIVQDKYY